MLVLPILHTSQRDNLLVSCLSLQSPRCKLYGDAQSAIKCQRQERCP